MGESLGSRVLLSLVKLIGGAQWGIQLAEKVECVNV